MENIINFGVTKFMKDLIVEESSIFYGKSIHLDKPCVEDVLELFDKDNQLIIDKKIPWTPQNLNIFLKEIDFWGVSSIPYEYTSFVNSLESTKEIEHCLSVFDSFKTKYSSRVYIDMLYTQLAFIKFRNFDELDDILQILSGVFKRVSVKFMIQISIKYSEFTLFKTLCPDYFSKLPKRDLYRTNISVGKGCYIYTDECEFEHLSSFVHGEIIKYENRDFLRYILGHENIFIIQESIIKNKENIYKSSLSILYKNFVVDNLYYFVQDPYNNHMELVHAVNLTYDDLLKDKNYISSSSEFPSYIWNVLPFEFICLHDSTTQVKILMKHNMPTLYKKRYRISKKDLDAFLKHKCVREIDYCKLSVILLNGVFLYKDKRKRFHHEVPISEFQDDIFVEDTIQNNLENIFEFIKIKKDDIL